MKFTYLITFDAVVVLAMSVVFSPLLCIYERINFKLLLDRSTGQDTHTGMYTSFVLYSWRFPATAHAFIG